MSQQQNKVLILGASGATGRLVVQRLIKQNVATKIVVRSNSNISSLISESSLVEIVTGNILEFDLSEYKKLIHDCDTIISCLGHNITLKGIFGNPRMLVTNAIQNICDTIEAEGNHSYKVILMNTTANVQNTESKILSTKDKIIFSLLKKFLPPHADNIAAANFLINGIGTDNPKISWVIVRPDSLVNENSESDYETYKSHICNPLTNPGKTSRINVAHFITELLLDGQLWQKWEGQLPVIYNSNK